MKKIILKAAVTAAVLFALAAGTAGVPTVQERPAEARERCVGLNCWPANSPIKHVPGHYASLPPVW